MIEQDEIFRYFHMYRRLVRRGLVQPLRHSCGAEYVTGFGTDDGVSLNCYGCNTKIIPGSELISQVRAVVKEHFYEDS